MIRNTSKTFLFQRRVRPSREVIVQRAEVERREGRDMRDGRDGRDVRRGDGRNEDWADPWMRAEPAARRRKPPSSDDSYSSSRYKLGYSIMLGQIVILVVFSK